VLNLSPSVTYLFRVEALDASGNQTHGGPTLLVDLSDQTPPWWPEGASCSEVDLTTTSVTLNWSTAEDNTGVARYLVFANGEELEQTNGATQTLSVTGLSALTEYSFQIFAVDGVGNTSEDGPVVLISTPDFPVPSWPEEAQLSVPASGSTWVSLSWTQMPQTDAVSAIVLYQDDEEALTLDANETSATLSGLSPLTTYDLRVEASGPTGLVSTDGPSITITTADYTTPEWINSAELTATDVTETSLLLTWTGVLNIASVSSFTVIQDEDPIATVYPPSDSLIVNALNPGTRYSFTVEATGPTGLESTSGPTVTVMTQDSEAPSWPDGAAITLDWVNTGSAGISWDPATDNVAVQSYDVYLQGAFALSVDGQTTDVTLADLNPQSLYTVQVRALDPAMNQSEDALEASFTTQAATSGLSTQDIFEGLLPHCSFCHESQPTPFFLSLNDFESLVANNEELVLPRDPDGSVFIQILEGNGPAPWVQMPLSGQSFVQLSNAGDTSITMAQIRAWVLHLEGD
jgi:chitodextrinase